MRPTVVTASSGTAPTLVPAPAISCTDRPATRPTPAGSAAGFAVEQQRGLRRPSLMWHGPPVSGVGFRRLPHPHCRRRPRTRTPTSSNESQLPLTASGPTSIASPALRHVHDSPAHLTPDGWQYLV